MDKRKTNDSVYEEEINRIDSYDDEHSSLQRFASFERATIPNIITCGYIESSICSGKISRNDTDTLGSLPRFNRPRRIDVMPEHHKKEVPVKKTWKMKFNDFLTKMIDVVCDSISNIF